MSNFTFSFNIYIIICIVISLLISNVVASSKNSISSPGAISSFAPGGQYIMLTFDDGPDPINTPILLDILKKKNIKATFFVLGQMAINQPDILYRIDQEGHELANHGWNHAIMTKIPREALHHQIQSTSRVISKATEKGVTTLMRPPFGNTNFQINEYMKGEEKMKVILWSLDSKDWETKDPKEIVSNIVNNAKPGDIILCHDVHKHTVDAIEEVIDKLTIQGYEFLTISQILSFPDDSPHRRLLRG